MGGGQSNESQENNDSTTGDVGNKELDVAVIKGILSEYGAEAFPEEFDLSHKQIEHLEGLPWSAVRLNIKRRYGTNRPDWLTSWTKCYHGTGESGMKGILREGFDLDLAVRQRFGPGVYTTPKFGVAASYARQKIFEQADGYRYLVVLECRADPDHTRSVKATGLLDGAEYFVTDSDDNVRPVKLHYHYMGEGQPAPHRFRR